MASYLAYPSPEESDEGWSAVLDSVHQTMGYVPNYTKLFGLHPAAWAGWRGLIGAISHGMDERRYELATVAAARRLDSSYCSLAHGKILAEKFHTPEEVVGIYDGTDPGALDEVDRAVMDLADKVVADATSITEADIERLRDLGLGDRDIFAVILAAARCFFSKVLDATGTLPDAVYHSLDPELRRTLTPGRPIETA